MLLYRMLSALVGIPLIVALLWIGGDVWLLAVGLLALVGMWEMFNIVNKSGAQALKYLGIVDTLVILMLAYWWPQNSGMAIVLILALHLLVLIFLFPKISLADIGVSLFVNLYVIWFMTYLYLLRKLPNGFAWVLFIFFINWATDTAAYFVGRSFGKHKLAARVSPKKTIEGSLGGVAGSLCMVFLFPLFVPLPVAGNSYWLLILAIAISIFGQLGDLAESALKRHAMVKDSSSLIPGHGGVLDRFDSILLTAPLAYYFITLLIL